jgi:hypothetical protein
LVGGRSATESARLFAFVKAARHFLQAQDVEIVQRLCFGDDAREIDAAIHAASPLNVPVD